MVVDHLPNMNVFAGNGLYSFSFSLSKRNKIKAHELIDHLGGELFPHLLTFFFFFHRSGASNDMGGEVAGCREGGEEHRS